MSAAPVRATGIDTLPESVVHHILSLLSPADLSAAASVCKDWHEVAQDELMWLKLALKKWRVETVHLKYYKTYQALVKHHNKDGASVILPLEEGKTKCLWRPQYRAARTRYYECQVLQAEWFRAQDSEPSSAHWRNCLAVYVDARGEADLREAHSSTLAVIAWFPNQEGRLPEVQQLIEAHSGPYFLENKPGHQLACLHFGFDGELFRHPTDAQLSLEFWYACPPIGRDEGPGPLSTYEDYSDYTRVPIIRRMGSHEFKQFLRQHIREGPFDRPYRRGVWLARESDEVRLARWMHISDEKLFDQGWFV